jgi:hypothetical protein
LKLVYVVGIAYGAAALFAALFVKNLNIKAQATPTEPAAMAHPEAANHREKHPVENGDAMKDGASTR